MFVNEYRTFKSRRGFLLETALPAGALALAPQAAASPGPPDIGVIGGTTGNP